MKTFITSDLHFSHTNIMKFCPQTRQYDNVDEMNESMISEWNETVEPTDLTYILGDFAFASAEVSRNIARRLNGRKILIQGNHDVKILKDPGFRACFDEIHIYHEITVLGNKVCMFHYPIAEWNQCHRGSVHFHGHLHGNVSGLERWRALDAGMDATGCVVVEMEDFVRRALAKEVRGHGYRQGDV